MVLNRLGFVAAQLIPKPGARQTLARAVTVDDLPGEGWAVFDERTWRTGVTGPATEWNKRARAAGGITAWRSFELANRQWCWAQVMPLASESDALQAIEVVGARGVRNLRSQLTVLQERDVELDPFPGAGRVWAHEQHTSGPLGNGVARMMAAAVGSHLIVVSGSGSPEWMWDALIALARRKARLLAAA